MQVNMLIVSMLSQSYKFHLIAGRISPRVRINRRKHEHRVTSRLLTANLIEKHVDEQELRSNVLKLSKHRQLADRSSWYRGIDCPLTLDMLSFGKMGRVVLLGRMPTVVLFNRLLCPKVLGHA